MAWHWREVLRYSEVESVALVDLDPAITELAQENIYLTELNEGSLSDFRVQVINADAMVWLNELREQGKLSPYDLVIVDFPDPSTFSIGKLYTTRFYNLARLCFSLTWSDGRFSQPPQCMPEKVTGV